MPDAAELRLATPGAELSPPPPVHPVITAAIAAITAAITIMRYLFMLCCLLR